MARNVEELLMANDRWPMSFDLADWLSKQKRTEPMRFKRTLASTKIKTLQQLGWATAAALWLIAAEASAATLRFEWVLPERANSGAPLTPATVLGTVLTCDGVDVASWSGPVTMGHAVLERSANCVVKVRHLDVSDPSMWIQLANGTFVPSPLTSPPTMAPRVSLPSQTVWVDIDAPCWPPSVLYLPRPAANDTPPVFVSACNDPDVVYPSGALLDVLRNALAASPELDALRASGDWAGLARALNAPTQAKVWLRVVSAAQLGVCCLPWDFVDAMTSTKWRIIEGMLTVGWISPADPETRAGLLDALGLRFPTVLDNLTRPATVLESIYASYPAAGGVPAAVGTLTVSGAISDDYLRDALSVAQQ